MPLIYLYFKSFTSESSIRPKDFLWFIPGILIFVATVLIYSQMSEQDMIQYVLYGLSTQYAVYGLNALPASPLVTSAIYDAQYTVGVTLYSIIVLIQTLMISTYMVYSVIRYHRRLKSFYSNFEDKSMDLDKSILAWVFATLLVTLIYMSIGKSFWIQHPVITAFYFVIWAVAYFGVGYIGSRPKFSVDTLALDMKQASINDFNADDDDSKEEFHSYKYPKLVADFNRLMEEERIYLNSDLRIDNIALQMSTSMKNVTLIISEQYQCSFSDYVNQLRVGYSIELMQQNKELNYDEVATQSGFMSLKAFCKSFKQVVGMLPHEM